MKGMLADIPYDIKFGPWNTCCFDAEPYVDVMLLNYNSFII